MLIFTIIMTALTFIKLGIRTVQEWTRFGTEHAKGYIKRTLLVIIFIHIPIYAIIGFILFGW